MISRFGFIAAKKGVWEVVKISTGPWVQYADHAHALAEKERAYKQEIGRHKDTIHDLIVRQAADSAAYQQLLAQAVRFAQLCAVRVVHSEAGDFLACPEAQAFLKEHP